MDFLHPILAQFPGPHRPPGPGLAELAGSPHAILMLLGGSLALLAYVGRREQDVRYAKRLAWAFLAVVVKQAAFLAGILGRKMAGAPTHFPPVGGPPPGGPPPLSPDSLIGIWADHLLTVILFAVTLQYLMRRDEPGRRFLLICAGSFAALAVGASLTATPGDSWPLAMHLAGTASVIAAFVVMRSCGLERGGLALMGSMAVFLLRDAMMVAVTAFAAIPVRPVRPGIDALTVVGLLVLGYLFVREYTTAFHTDVETLQSLVDERTDELRSTLDQLSGMNAVLRAQSTLDPLTGVNNRRRFDEALREEWIRAKEMDEPLAMALIDLDCFKSINDGFGHPAGDQCLVLVTEALRAAVRGPTDIVARYGGDEFAVLLPGLDAEEAGQLLETARAEIESFEGVASALELSFTVSIGVASRRRGEIETADELVRLADRALYRSKTKGRNRVEASSVPFADAAGA